MNKLRMSLENIQGKLSRKEMRNIMAGSGSTDCGFQTYCGNALNQPCTTSNGTTGKCGVRTAETQCRCL